MDKSAHQVWAVSATIIGLGLLGSMSHCDYRVKEVRIAEVEAERSKAIACVESGGQWLRVPNVASVSECRR